MAVPGATNVSKRGSALMSVPIVLGVVIDCPSRRRSPVSQAASRCRARPPPPNPSGPSESCVAWRHSICVGVSRNARGPPSRRAIAALQPRRRLVGRCGTIRACPSPVPAPAEPRVQFRCCPRCGVALASVGRVRCTVRRAASPTTSTRPCPRRASCCAATGRRCSSGAATSRASAGWPWSAASSTRARRRKRHCAARCARRSASSWTRSDYLGSQPNTYAYRGITYHVVDLSLRGGDGQRLDAAGHRRRRSDRVA